MDKTEKVAFLAELDQVSFWRKGFATEAQSHRVFLVFLCVSVAPWPTRKAN